MNIHPGHIGFAIALYHAQKLPSVLLIGANMVGHQIGRRDTFGAQIFHSHIQQLPCDTLTAVAFLRVHGADIANWINGKTV